MFLQTKHSLELEEIASSVLSLPPVIINYLADEIILNEESQQQERKPSMLKRLRKSAGNVFKRRHTNRVGPLPTAAEEEKVRKESSRPPLREYLNEQVMSIVGHIEFTKYSDVHSNEASTMSSLDATLSSIEQSMTEYEGTHITNGS